VTHFCALVTIVFIAQVRQKPRFATLHVAVLIAIRLCLVVANYSFSSRLLKWREKRYVPLAEQFARNFAAKLYIKKPNYRQTVFLLAK
jgi:hypothetical protein